MWWICIWWQCLHWPNRRSDSTVFELLYWSLLLLSPLSWLAAIPAASSYSTQSNHHLFLQQLPSHLFRIFLNRLNFTWYMKSTRYSWFIHIFCMGLYSCVCIRDPQQGTLSNKRSFCYKHTFSTLILNLQKSQRIPGILTVSQLFTSDTGDAVKYSSVKCSLVQITVCWGFKLDPVE